MFRVRTDVGFLCRCWSFQMSPRGHDASHSIRAAGCGGEGDPPKPSSTWSTHTYRRSRSLSLLLLLFLLPSLLLARLQWCAVFCSALLGIRDLSKPDYGESVEPHAGDVPVFWACGVTAIEAILSSSESNMVDSVLFSDWIPVHFQNKLLQYYFQQTVAHKKHI